METTQADLNEIMQITISLNRPTHDNGMTLKQYADAVMAGNIPPMNHDEFTNQFGTEPEVMQAALNWASSNNLNVVESHPGASTIKVKGSVQQFNNLFNLSLLSATSNTAIGQRTYITHEGSYTVPTEMTPHVDFILGLDNQYTYRPLFGSAILPQNQSFQGKQEVGPNGQTLFYSTLKPNNVCDAYQIPAGDGKNWTVGLIELTDYPYGDNLGTGWFPGGNGLDVTWGINLEGVYSGGPITNIYVDGVEMRQGSLDTESVLDIWCASGAAPKSNIAYYLGYISDQGFYNVLMAAAMDVINYPAALGISWGADYHGDVLDPALQACIAVGIAPFIASGDSGANYGVPIYPGCSAYAASCGATRLGLYYSNNDYYHGTATYGAEQAASNTWDLVPEFASGGGIGAAIPSWQASKNLMYYKYQYYGSITTGPYPLTGRGYPDMSAPGSNTTPYNIYAAEPPYSYNSQLVYGTSAAAPLWAGIHTRLCGILNKRLGLRMDLYYNNPSVFRDITVGNNDWQDNHNTPGNFGYLCTIGWDPVTGWGSPDGNALLNMFQDNPPSPFPDRSLYRFPWWNYGGR